MAGTWIIMKHDLQTSPEVWKIEGATGLDTYGVIGRLHKVWSWADNQTADGLIEAPAALVDRLAECDGFAAAMVAVGWMVDHGDQIEFPDFGDHNGKTAKGRASAFRRQQKARREKCHASVTHDRDKSVTDVTHDRDKSVTDVTVQRDQTAQDITSQNKTTPAAARSDITPEVHLANAAVAAAVGIDLSGVELWEALGKRAGLDRDTAGQCADTINRAPPDLHEHAVVALERLSEAIASQSVQTPVGLLRSILGEAGCPSPARKTVARQRKDERERKALIEQCAGWPAQYRAEVYEHARETLPKAARAATPESPTDGWAALPHAMLDYIARNYAYLAATVASKAREGAA
jgi:hypothetical protein